MPFTDADPGTRCACDFSRCQCGNDADVVTSHGVAMCGCCVADCPDVHDQDLIVIARAVPWSGGWELHVDDVGITQVVDLTDATNQVRSLMSTVGRIDADAVRVLVMRSREDLEAQPLSPEDSSAE